MINTYEAGEILWRARTYAETRAEWWVAAFTGDHDDTQRRGEIAQEADAELCRYVRGLVMPPPADEEVLRDRIHAINASAHGGPTFVWGDAPSAEQIRETIEALNAKPPEWWQEIARQFKEREAERMTADGRRIYTKQEWNDRNRDDGRVTLSDQEAEQVPQSEVTDASNQNRRPRHHGGH